jgi:LacI family transcriptional regulator
LGFKVPQDVSIIGFDDIELAEIAYPALTTVHVPHREMGRRAAEALIKLLNEGTQIEAVELEASLVFRDTLAPARN